MAWRLRKVDESVCPQSVAGLKAATFCSWSCLMQRKGVSMGETAGIQLGRIPARSGLANRAKEFAVFLVQ